MVEGNLRRIIDENSFLSRIQKRVEGTNHIFIIVVLFFILLSGYLYFGPQPTITGDGGEYLGMTCSFFNHLSPDLRSEDSILRNDTVHKNNIVIPEDFKGYFKSEDNLWYSYHFWFYSLCSLPVFAGLHCMNLNELRCFQITNLILFLLPLLFIAFHTKLSNFSKFWFLAFAAVNPVLFYINWSHPEVFSYTFVLLAILFFINGNTRIAVFMSSVASLQNPPIIIFTLFLFVLAWKKKSREIKEFGLLLLAAVLTCLPFIFYYINFNTVSLITFYGVASLSKISTGKILSLFFDLNFGIFPYLPILLLFTIVVFFISLWNKDFFVPSLWGVLFLMALLSSTQANWNSGMMYINRYAVYMIPILILMAIYSIRFFSKRTIAILFGSSLIITGCITGVLLLNNDYANYLQFNYLSKSAMTIYPGIYNPDFEIFGERARGAEVDYDTILPVIVTYDGRIRKIFTNEQNLEVIKNWGINITPSEENDIHRHGRGYINMNPILLYSPPNKDLIHIYINNTDLNDIFGKNISMYRV
jgi:hypothetical protein